MFIIFDLILDLVEWIHRNFFNSFIISKFIDSWVYNTIYCFWFSFKISIFSSIFNSKSSFFFEVFIIKEINVISHMIIPVILHVISVIRVFIVAV